MGRLFTAFAIAAMIHAALFLTAPTWTLHQAPRLAHRQALTMRLVAHQAYRPPAMHPPPQPPAPLPPLPPTPPAPRPPKTVMRAPKPPPAPAVSKPKPVNPKPAPPTIPVPAEPEPVAAVDPPRETRTETPPEAPVDPLPDAGPQSDVNTAPDTAVSNAAAVASEATVVLATPRYRDNPLPDYPRIARKRGIQGTVILEVFVEADGRVGDLRIAESSRHSMLDRAALKTVHRWLFEPGRDGQRAVAMWVRVPVDFRLQ